MASASIVVLGLNHKTAPVGLLERLAIPEEQLAKALHQLAAYEHVSEGVVLSTCNRIEVYAVVSKFHGGAQDLRNFLAEFCHIAPEDFADHLYTYHDDGAVRHLFRVTSGIDSMVVGESEILGQVRRAYQAGAEGGFVGKLLGTAFRRALRVGKRSRAETAIGRNPASVSTAAVELARRAFAGGTLAGKRVVIVGAGKMGRLAVKALTTAGATDVVIVNRSEDRARSLAVSFAAEAHSMDELPAILATADILISSTMAPGTIIGRDIVADAVAARDAAAPLFIVDIAVPRDVDPAVSHLPGVVLRDIEDLKGVVDATLGSRVGEVSKVEGIIGSELEQFVKWERASESAPSAAALVSKVDEIRAAELQRIRAHLDAMTPEQRDAVDHLSRRLVAKILHTPLLRARDLSGSQQGQVYLEALRELFELDESEG